MQKYWITWIGLGKIPFCLKIPSCLFWLTWWECLFSPFRQEPDYNWNILLYVDWDSEVKVFLLLAKDKDNWSFSGTMKVSGKRDATQMLTGSSTHSLPQNGAHLHLAWHCTAGACSLCRVKVKCWGQLLGSPGSANEAVSSAFLACPLRRGRKKKQKPLQLMRITPTPKSQSLQQALQSRNRRIKCHLWC